MPRWLVPGDPYTPLVTISVDRVTLEIERHVVRVDHDAVIRTIDQVTVERRVARDHIAALDVIGERLTGAQRDGGSDSGNSAKQRSLSIRSRTRIQCDLA